MKHSPLIRLQAAQRAVSAAQQNCPHWDYEGLDGSDDCCVDLREAERELILAKRATSPTIEQLRRAAQRVKASIEKES